MKGYLIIGGVVIVAIIVLFIIFFRPVPSTDTVVQSTSGLPIAESVTPSPVGSSSSSTPATSATISFAGQNDAAIIVKDFIHNGETVADVVNPGSYILAGTVGYCLADGTCPSGNATTDFNISYNASTHFFNIVLLKEPLGTIRLEAEQFLADRLGLTGQQPCVLKYAIGAPYWVNAGFADKNLGFSFCPGATVLPK